MLTESLKRITPALALSLALLFTYESLADSSCDTATTRAASPKARAVAGPILHGSSIARFGGYDLNISFTPDGKLLCLNISASANPK